MSLLKRTVRIEQSRKRQEWGPTVGQSIRFVLAGQAKAGTGRRAEPLMAFKTLAMGSIYLIFSFII